MNPSSSESNFERNERKMKEQISEIRFYALETLNILDMHLAVVFDFCIGVQS